MTTAPQPASACARGRGPSRRRRERCRDEQAHVLRRLLTCACWRRPPPSGVGRRTGRALGAFAARPRTCWLRCAAPSRQAVLASACMIRHCRCFARAASHPPSPGAPGGCRPQTGSSRPGRRPPSSSAWPAGGWWGAASGPPHCPPQSRPPGAAGVVEGSGVRRGRLCQKASAARSQAGPLPARAAPSGPAGTRGCRRWRRTRWSAPTHLQRGPVERAASTVGDCGSGSTRKPPKHCLQPNPPLQYCRSSNPALLPQCRVWKGGQSRSLRRQAGSAVRRG